MIISAYTPEPPFLATALHGMERVRTRKGEREHWIWTGMEWGGLGALRYPG
jgi:hypothetical protein